MSSDSGNGKRITVLGLGNPLMGDDGFGVRAIDALRPHLSADVRVLDGGLLGLDLLGPVEDASHLLILDAIDASRDPGTVLRYEGAEVAYAEMPSISPHQLHAADVLTLARLRGSVPESVIVLGVQPARVELGVGLSPQVEAAIGDVVKAALGVLSEWESGRGR